MIDLNHRDNTNRPYLKLTSRQPEDIIYDCTHDNPSVVEKFQTGRMALPHIGLASLADKAIATTWGYDHLVHKQIHCVEDKRLYPIDNQQDIIVDIISSPQEVRIPETPIKTAELPEPKAFNYDFKASFPNAKSVALAHSWNNWKSDLMMRNVGGSNWAVSFEFPAHTAGQKVFFKFVINGKDWLVSKEYGTQADEHNNINNMV